jgi:transposase
MTLGLDAGDKLTHFSVVDPARAVVARGKFRSTEEDMRLALAKFRGSKVILEAGSMSPWMSRALQADGFIVHVVDPRRVQLITHDPRKNDRRDAEMLARIGAAMPEVLGRVHHRGEQAQAHLSVIRARDLLVRLRKAAVNQVRGLCKAFGKRLPAASTEAFPKRVQELVPELLHSAVVPILDTITELTKRIRAFDNTLTQLAKDHYPETKRLQQVHGVGPVISIAFVLTVEDPKRFSNARRIGSWLGLCPRSHASGESNPQLRISKAGDAYMRRLLVQGAQYILGPFGKDSDLRRYGLALMERGGKLAKKKATVAVARKLSILLLRLWRTGTVYESLHNAKRRGEAAACAS